MVHRQFLEREARVIDGMLSLPLAAKGGYVKWHIS